MTTQVAMPLEKGDLVKELVPGTPFRGVFLVVRRAQRKTKRGDPMLNLTLRDSTGSIEATVWSDSPAFGDYAEGDFILAQGDVELYRDARQLKLSRAQVVPASELSEADFLPAGQLSLESMRESVAKWVTTIEDPHLRALLEIFAHDDELAYDRAPAATALHHAYVGGLLEHTLSLMNLADTVAWVYRNSGIAVNRDLLIVGAFLHDIGKAVELAAAPGFPYTDQGQLLGHVALGYEIVIEAIAGVEGFPDPLRDQLLHLVLSHHGELEHGAPVVPRTLEALILHQLDTLDAKVGMYRKAVADAGERPWTDFVPALGRTFYRRGSE